MRPKNWRTNMVDYPIVEMLYLAGVMVVGWILSKILKI